jgi:hypothetical protein
MQPATDPTPENPGLSAVPGRGALSTGVIANRRSNAAAAFTQAALTHPPKSRRTGFLLCLFLGWAGSHRYYVGKRGTGRLYLLTSGLLLVGVLVDLVAILTGNFHDGRGRPLG